jgi:uncharacterized protein
MKSRLQKKVIITRGVTMVRVAKTQRENIEDILRKLATVGQVEGTAVISRDGLLIADALPKNLDAEIFSSMSATMHGAAETALSELKRGVCQMTLAESEKNSVVSLGVNPTFLLVALAKKGVNLGLLRVEMKKTAATIAKLL